jgi:hypothetical protein
MFNALRYYWIIAKGYRLCPWKSPYIQWRMETFFGHEAADLNRAKFFHLTWRERERMRQFLRWVGQRRAAQRTAEHEWRNARKHRSE